MLARLFRTAVFLVALAVPRASSAALPPVRVGQEWSYTGSTRATGGEESAERSYVTTVTVVGRPGGQPEVARFRQTGITPFRAPASLAWLGRAPEEAETDLGARPLDVLPLPVPFGTGRKLGERWISRAPFLGLSPPVPQTLPFRHRVLCSDRVGSRRCWRIERTIAAPLPLTAWTIRVLAYRELFWVDASRGVLLRYQGNARFQRVLGKAPVTTVAASLEWRGVRTLPAAAVRERRDQARLLTEAAGLLFSRSGPPGEVLLQQAQARLATFRQSYPRSDYAPAAQTLGGLIRTQLGYIEQGQALAQQQAALVGKPAPALPLKDMEGKEHTLGEYHGKLILLNVFASW